MIARAYLCALVAVLASGCQPAPTAVERQLAARPAVDSFVTVKSAKNGLCFVVGRIDHFTIVTNVPCEAIAPSI